MEFSGKAKETAECRFCRYAAEDGEGYVCSKKGRVAAADSCRAYRFDPFAKRERRLRNPDLSALDPLDFEV